MRNDPITPGDFLDIFKKHLTPILVAVLISALLGGLLFLFLPRSYAAECKFYVRQVQSEAFLNANGLTSSQLATVQTLAREYAQLIPDSDELLDRVIERHGLSLSRKELRAMLSTDTRSTVFSVTVTGKDPLLCQKVMQALAAEVADYLNQTAWPQLSFPVILLLHTDEAAHRVSPHPAAMAALFAGAGCLLSYLFFFVRFLFPPKHPQSEKNFNEERGN